MDFQLMSVSGLFACAVYFLAGVIDSVCGGGGLITVPAMMAAGVPTAMLTGTNQCAIVVGNFVSTYRFAKEGKVRWRVVLYMTPCAILGSVIGTKINQHMPENLLQIVMLVITPLLLILILMRKDLGDQSRISELSVRQQILRSVLIGLVLGGYQGFYGAGSGTLYLLALAILLRLDMLTSQGVARTVCAFASVSATVSYAASGLVIWDMAVAATVFNIFGCWIGSALAMTKGSKLIKPMMLLMITLLLLKILLG